MGRKKSASVSRGTIIRGPDPVSTITEGEIRQRAFEIFILRGGGAGDAVSDWLRAEAELRENSQRRASSAALDEKSGVGSEAELQPRTKGGGP